MSTQQLIAPEVSLPSSLPPQLPLPKFQLNQTLQFGLVPSKDFGRVAGIVYAQSATVQANGYHYLLLLDPESHSRKELGILCDWLFEEDACLVMQPFPFGQSSQQGTVLPQGQE